jgi:flagellin
MLNINTNYASAFASNAAKAASKGLDGAMEKLSSGSRINYAKDDAAGQAISTRLTAEIQGLQMASRNAADAQSLVDTVEGALQETHTVLLRMRELSVQSANGTMTNSDRQHLNEEFTQLRSEIDRIAHNTKWAGQSTLNGTETDSGTPYIYKSFSFQVGEGANQTISINIRNMNSFDMSSHYESGWNGGSTVNGVHTITEDSGPTHSLGITDEPTAGLSIKAIDAAIDSVSTERGKLGALSNRLSSTMSNLDQITVNLSVSQGRIQDADFAQETGNLAKNQILQQAATAMIAQANASKSSVLSLIR